MWGPIISGERHHPVDRELSDLPGVLAEHHDPVGRPDLAAASGEQFDAVVPVQEGGRSSALAQLAECLEGGGLAGDEGQPESHMPLNAQGRRHQGGLIEGQRPGHWLRRDEGHAPDVCRGDVGDKLGQTGAGRLVKGPARLGEADTKPSAPTAEHERLEGDGAA